MNNTSIALLLVAYACSGFAGLVYQVTWTRLLVLQVGHTTAAVTTVVAAFMAGLSGGAYLGSRWSRLMSPTRSLTSYGILEIAVALYAVLLPLWLTYAPSFLSLFYADGTAGMQFMVARTAMCLIAVGIPSLLLGATFPISLRALQRGDDQTVASGGRLYAVNTAGAAVGAVAAGFFLLPVFGIQRTSEIGAASSVAAALLALLATRCAPRTGAARPSQSVHTRDSAPQPQDRLAIAIAAVVVTCTGFAGLLYEVSWMRAAAALLGPTTYAFAGTVAVLISGLALGGALGTAISRRHSSTHTALTLTLLITAGLVVVGNVLAGDRIPERLARLFAASADDAIGLMIRGAFPLFLCVLPPAIGFGTSLPLALRLADVGSRHESRVAVLYALNTAGGVAATLLFGSLLALFGLEGTLRVVPIGLMAAALAVVSSMPGKSAGFRVAMASPLAVMAIVLLAAPLSWNRPLLASGAYKYARGLVPDADLPSVLAAGTLRFYKDGQFATVTVKEFAGKTSLAIDGKVDGSSGADMLTQVLAAHIPLLLHERPDDVLVVGLGTGVTVASVATHAVKQIDVVEISPEVIEASHFFDDVNRAVLRDSRVRLIVGDARSHLALSRQKYDVVVSEPSNPWLAGVAALFTREAFLSMRERLAPGGLVCQWVHTYDMSEADFRSIIATFQSVFPDATLWTIGETDILLVSGTSSLDSHVANMQSRWSRTSVRDDLTRVGVQEPFAVMSLWAAGANTMSRLGGNASLQSDDRMALEFSAPLAAFRRGGSNQAPLVRRALQDGDIPAEVVRILKQASADQWTRRGAMFERMRLFDAAYADYRSALRKDPLQPTALTGLALTAVPAGRGDEAASYFKTLIASHPEAVRTLVAYSQLLAAMGLLDGAIVVAASGAGGDSSDRVLALEQLAALFADLGDAPRLTRVVEELDRSAPLSASTMYYTASLSLLEGRLHDAIASADRAIGVNPDDATTWNLRGAALARLGRRQEAKESFLRGLEYDPDDPAIYANLGMLWLEEGHRDESTRWFASALALDPESAVARDGMMQVRDRKVTDR